VEQALEEGVKLKHLTVPVAFESRNGRLARVRCLKMKLEGIDASGRPRPVPIEGSEFFIDADTAIVSIGQQADAPLGIGGDIKKTPMDGLEIVKNGETNIAGIYASGDAVSGPSTVVEAMASGRRVAQTIIRSLNTGAGPVPEESLQVCREPYDPVPRGIPKQVRSAIPHRKTSERIRDCDEVIAPLTAEDAMREASRCLQCGICCECLQCETSCELGAIRHGSLPVRRSSRFDQIILSGNRQRSFELDASRVISVGRHRDTNSWARAMVAGRGAAMAVLSKTSPSEVPPIGRKCLSTGDSKVGVFICSCNGTLNPNNQLAKMIAPLQKIPDVVHVEVLVSACHPEKGRRIEEVISARGLNGALIASCVCCHLDFACESCTDQRIRLKHRLFRESGYQPKDIALVNIKETCMLPYKAEGSVGVDRAIRVIRSGLSQLREHKAWSLRSEKAHPQALVLGATEAGIVAAKGLKAQFQSVVLVENREIHKGVAADLQRSEIDLVWPVKPVRLEGQRGNFTLIAERAEASGALIDKKKSVPAQTKKKRLRELSRKTFDEGPRYQKIQGGIVILGRREFKNIRYKRDAFAKAFQGVSSKAFGTLETGIPGVYLASWSQALKISDKALGASVAGKALEEIVGKTEPGDYLVAHVDPEFCRGCGSCADICPEGAAHLEEIARGVASSWIDPRLCTGCGNCISECPTGAIRMAESEQQYFEKVMNAILG
jgi:heterodisulfide reductase subunit A-like polyferredoxin